MKVICNFAAQLSVHLPPGISPDQGFFYLSQFIFTDLSDRQSLSLRSNFVHDTGETTFWEESVLTTWNRGTAEGEWIVDINGFEIGVELADHDYPHLSTQFRSFLDQDSEFSPDRLMLELSFRADGDDHTETIVAQRCLAIAQATFALATDQEWEDRGFG